MNIDYLLNEWAFRCPDGIPDMKDKSKLRYLKIILEENGIDPNEIYAFNEDEGKQGKSKIEVGDEFVMGANLGIFKKGDKVKVINIRVTDEDQEIELQGENGDIDIIYLDKEDSLEKLNESMILGEDDDLLLAE